MKWFKEIDYDMPEGAMLIGVDSLEVVFGVELFVSSDVRWNPLMGETSFTLEEVRRKFSDWYMGISDVCLRAAYQELEGPPKFHVFCNIT